MRYLIESIQIMNRFATENTNRSLLIIDFGFPKTGFNPNNEKVLTLLNSLFYMTVIDSYSFLQEYEEYFGNKTEIEFKKRIIDVKTINKPFLSKIKEWRQIGDLRNQLLAHNLRKGKNGQFIFSFENIDYSAPRTINDILLLSNLIGFMTQTINLEFSHEIKNQKKVNIKGNVMTSKQMTKDEVSKITVDLIIQATQEITKLHKKYSFDIKMFADWEKV